MDIPCPTCATPWGDRHLKEIEPVRWGISEEDQRRLRAVGGFSGKDDPALAAAQAAGWQFATERLLSFTHCLACPPPGALPGDGQRQAAAGPERPFFEGDPDDFITFLARELGKASEDEAPTGLFALGRICITSGALEATRDAGEQPMELVRRHTRGDWSELDAADAARNRRAIDRGQTILSVYTLKTGQRVYVLTEYDRSATTVLLPADY